MSNIFNSNILITGGASGIGRIMARMMLMKNAASVIIWDIHSDNLRATVDELKRITPNVYGYLVDVRNLDEVQAAFEQMRSEARNIDILINNAGIIVGKLFHDHSHQEITATMDININALMHIAREVLPSMIANRFGHICNIASAAGMVANPGMSVYCASKWAVIGWSESLRLEMEHENTGVRITRFVHII